MSHLWNTSLIEKGFVSGNVFKTYETQSLKYREGRTFIVIHIVYAAGDIHECQWDESFCCVRSQRLDQPWFLPPAFSLFQSNGIKFTSFVAPIFPRTRFRDFAKLQSLYIHVDIVHLLKRHKETNTIATELRDTADTVPFPFEFRIFGLTILINTFQFEFEFEKPRGLSNLPDKQRMDIQLCYLFREQYPWDIKQTVTRKQGHIGHMFVRTSFYSFGRPT